MYWRKLQSTSCPAELFQSMAWKLVTLRLFRRRLSSKPSLTTPPHGIAVDFDIFTAYSTQELFAKKAVIPPTPQMEALKSLPAPHVPDFDKDETVWVRDPHAPSPEPSPPSRSAGLSYPACIYCSQARY